jgi:type IV pilus assembly protein PilC
MAEFVYKARNSSGKTEEGKISAPSKDMARTLLARKRLSVVTIKEASLDDGDSSVGGRSFFGGKIRIDGKGNITFGSVNSFKVPDKDLVVMTKQLATMLNSGIPLNQSLDILSKQQRLPLFGGVLAGVRKAIEEGNSLSQALARYPLCFDSLYRSMIKAGEESGRLSDIMLKLLEYIEKSSKIKSQLKSAMVYPSLIIVVALAVVSGLMIFVVPAFTKQFIDAGKPLPAITQMVVDISDFFVNSWYVLLGGLIMAGVGLVQYIKTPKGRYQFDMFLLKMPIIGDVIKKISVGRFCSTMSSMLSSGVNLLQALNICAASSGNAVMEKFILECRIRIEKGQQMSVPLSENPIFPKMVVSMIQVGEQAGKTDEMLMKVAAFYEEEVDQAIKTMLGMIEPLLIVGIGGLVGFLVIAMYLPVFDLGGTIGN